MLATMLRGSSYYKDPYWSKTTALLLGNGADNSTTIIDSSPLASNWVAHGNAKISTGTKKYGTAALSLDGTAGTYLSASADSSNFTFPADFTIEAWLYTNPVGVQVIFDNRTASAGTFLTIYSNGTTIQCDSNNTQIVAGGTLPTNTWAHFAFSRSGTTTRMFINGIQVGINSSDTRSYLSGTPNIGASSKPSESLGYRWTGYMDDYRVTNGVGRYMSNFTPPTAELPVQ